MWLSYIRLRLYNLLFWSGGFCVPQRRLGELSHGTLTHESCSDRTLIHEVCFRMFSIYESYSRKFASRESYSHVP